MYFGKLFLILVFLKIDEKQMLEIYFLSIFWTFFFILTPLKRYIAVYF